MVSLPFQQEDMQKVLFTKWMAKIYYLAQSNAVGIQKNWIRMATTIVRKDHRPVVMMVIFKTKKKKNLGLTSYNKL